MTQPIQEPSTDRSVSGLTWGQSQLARRPASIPPAGAQSLPFIAANGSYTSDGVSSPAGDQLWTGVWLDANDVQSGIDHGGDPVTGEGGFGFGSYFGFSTCTGCHYDSSDDSFQLLIYNLGPAIYSFTLAVSTPDLNDAADSCFDIALDLQLTHSAHPFPNWFDLGITNGWVRSEQRACVATGDGGQIVIARNWTLPMIPSSNNDFAEIALVYPGSFGGGEFWTFKLWVQRLGDTSWTPDDFVDPTVGFA